MVVKQNYSDTEQLLVLDTGENGGISITNAGGGSFTISITDTQTATLAAGKYVYSLLATKQDGTKEYIIFGAFIVESRANV